MTFLIYLIIILCFWVLMGFVRNAYYNGWLSPPLPKPIPKSYWPTPDVEMRVRRRSFRATSLKPNSFKISVRIRTEDSKSFRVIYGKNGDSLDVAVRVVDNDEGYTAYLSRAEDASSDLIQSLKNGCELDTASWEEIQADDFSISGGIFTLARDGLDILSLYDITHIYAELDD